MELEILDVQQEGHAEDRWLRRLDFLWLELTHKCNLRCVHCYASAGPSLPLVDGMTYERWRNVLEEAYTLGCRKVQFTGGEPTLHPSLPHLITDAHSLGYEFIEVFTNGTCISERLWQIFRSLNIHLAFSLYGSRAEVHEAVTMREGSFSKTLTSISRAVEEGLTVRVAIIEMAQNTHDVEATKELLQKIGVKNVGTDRVRGVGRGEKLHPAEDPMAELCGACWRGQLAVDPQGNIFPCIFSRFCKVGCVSNGLREALNNPLLHEFRKKVREMHQNNGVSCRPDDCNPYCRPNCTPYEDCSPNCLPW